MFDVPHNEEKDQDRVEDSFELFTKTGDVLFPQNRKVYSHFATRVTKEWNATVLEAGAGIGAGTATYCRYIGGGITATDKYPRNVGMGMKLYPFMSWGVWDLGWDTPWKDKHDFVVAFEVIEHVKDYKRAIRNLVMSANREVWISTPNAKDWANDPNKNPYHVIEFSLAQMRELLKDYNYEVRRWDTFELIEGESDVNPLIYIIRV